MTDIEKAKHLLTQSNATLVLCHGDETVISEKRGIAPMLDFISEKRVLNGFSAADKIVGKAAAMLFVLAGIKKVYAEVLSEAAVEVLSENGIEYSYGVLTERIINRKGTGICPMEQTVENISVPMQAYDALIKKVYELRSGSKS